MTLHTASEGISFAREMEEATAGYYEELAKVFPDHAERFTAYAAANAKFVKNVQRTYYGVITDGIEGCYAFKGIEPDDYVIDVDVGDDIDLATALAKAVKNEETIVAYYKEAAEQSKGVMHDVPHAFLMVVKKKVARIDELKALAAS
jgi:predicted YcjX-like family ATPase